MEKPVRALDRPARRALGMHWRHRASLVCLGVLMISSCLGAEAFASFSSAPAAPTMSLHANTLAAPTGLTGSGGCALIIVGPQVSLNWTASPSAAVADSYEILRSGSSGGPYSVKGTSDNDVTNLVDTNLLGLSTTYYYVVRAHRGNWTSPYSNQVSVTTPLLCL